MLTFLKHTPQGSCVSLEVLQFAPEEILRTFSFHWSKEGTRRPIPTSDPNAVEISSVSKEHFGHYKCEVKKGEKHHFTAHIALLEIQSK